MPRQTSFGVQEKPKMISTLGTALVDKYKNMVAVDQFETRVSWPSSLTTS